MRVADAERTHVFERVADIVDRAATLADALRDQARPAVQVELAHIGGVRRIGEKRERPDLASGADLHLEQARRVNAPRHLALPQAPQRVAHASGVNPERHAQAGAAAAQAHYQPRPALGAAIARRQDAQRPVIAVDAAERFLAVRKAG